MDYQIKKLTDELIFIQWRQTPTVNSEVENQYLKELEQLLTAAPQPVYFLSDLRSGRIVNLRAIRRLGELTQHRNWAGSTAFSKDPITSLLVRSFQSYAQKSPSKNEMQTTPEEALSFLEALKPGLTEGIDWPTVLKIR
ncbi:MAG TPA: hypothetical protein VHO69_12245 [Phototrophicaceae bacterium]|nr:hypothetical protein [Phototrophicaceae bacterium]